MKRILTVTLFILFGFFFLAGSWELQKDENGIKVYTALKEGSEFKKCKVITTFKTTLSDVYEYIRNPLNFKKFSNKIESLKVVKKTDKSVFYYMSIDMPWPVYNRDGVYEIKTIEKTDGKIVLQSKARPDLMPEQEGYIRIKEAETSYKLVKEDDGKVKIYYEKFVDPNGSLPAWASNEFLIDGPIKQFTQMKKDLEK